jgi:voltage-gated potassium channel
MTVPDIRRRTHAILDIAAPDDGVSRVVDFALITLITLNVVAVILESVPSLAAVYGDFFNRFETFSVVVFSVEYVLRVWSAVDDDEIDHGHPVFGRMRFMLTPMALIDLIAILPFYLGFFIGVDLRFMRVLRLLRVFKLTRYSSSMSLLIEVLREEARSIGAAFFVLAILIILSASFMFLAEQEAQPEAFGSIPQALWWAIITMTTIGYGDVTPITVVGKILGACISVISVGMVALPAGLLASGFTGALRRRRIEYEEMVEDALKDGVVTDDEEASLGKAKDALGLSDEDARTILDTFTRKGPATTATCPHCGKLLLATRASGDDERAD